PNERKIEKRIPRPQKGQPRNDKRAVCRVACGSPSWISASLWPRCSYLCFLCVESFGFRTDDAAALNSHEQSVRSAVQTTVRGVPRGTRAQGAKSRGAEANVAGEHPLRFSGWKHGGTGVGLDDGADRRPG